MAGAFGAGYGSSNYVFLGITAKTLCRCSDERMDVFNGKNAKKPDAFH